jgi:hypothetical protein
MGLNLEKGYWKNSKRKAHQAKPEDSRKSISSSKKNCPTQWETFRAGWCPSKGGLFGKVAGLKARSGQRMEDGCLECFDEDQLIT